MTPRGASVISAASCSLPFWVQPQFCPSHYHHQHPCMGPRGFSEFPALIRGRKQPCSQTGSGDTKAEPCSARGRSQPGVTPSSRRSRRTGHCGAEAECFQASSSRFGCTRRRFPWETAPRPCQHPPLAQPCAAGRPRSLSRGRFKSGHKQLRA